MAINIDKMRQKLDADRKIFHLFALSH